MKKLVLGTAALAAMGVGLALSHSEQNTVAPQSRDAVTKADGMAQQAPQQVAYRRDDEYTPRHVSGGHWSWQLSPKEYGLYLLRTGRNKVNNLKRKLWKTR